MSDRAPSLGPGAEFDAIRAIIAGLGDRASGIGDDAAMISVPRGDQLVASVDAAIEGVHFRREWLTPREIGRRATVAALSDLAAMGATPIAILSALEVSESWRGALPEIARGVAEGAASVGARVVGGNTTRGSTLALTTTVLGSVFRPLRRDGARPGDRVYVTGQLGGPGAALQAWLGGATPRATDRARFVSPVARIAEARWLAAAGASACIDVSDGVVADLGHLAAASGVAITIDADRVPCLDGIGVESAIASGEEYELALTATMPMDARSFAARFGVPLTEIGVVAAGEPGVTLTARGQRVAPPSGHDHFSS